MISRVKTVTRLFRMNTGIGAFWVRLFVVHAHTASLIELYTWERSPEGEVGWKAEDRKSRTRERPKKRESSLCPSKNSLRPTLHLSGATRS